jgi:hypothetical protein
LVGDHGIVLGGPSAVKRNAHRLDVINDALGLRARYREDTLEALLDQGHLHIVKVRVFVGAKIDFGASDLAFGIDSCENEGKLVGRNTLELIVQDGCVVLGSGFKARSENDEKHEGTKLSS